jgi:LPXTG-site transpeptidase (sortase) family protein
MTSGRPEPRPLRVLRLTLIAIGFTCLAWVAFVTLDAAFFDWRARSAFAASAADSSDRGTRGGVIGILEIPRLGLSEVVAAGDGDGTLRVAVGHLPDTPLPWQPGNSALAGHRDGRFRALKDVQIGDTIRLETHRGVLNYVLRATHIVDPDDVWVLNPTSTRTLTLITCYPFSYIGAAPKRFVLMADAKDRDQ